MTRIEELNQRIANYEQQLIEQPHNEAALREIVETLRRRRINALHRMEHDAAEEQRWARIREQRAAVAFHDEPEPPENTVGGWIALCLVCILIGSLMAGWRPW